MSRPPDIQIRRLRPRDVPEVYKLLNAVLREEEGAELKRQIRALFLHPVLWLVSAAFICGIGIGMEYV